MDNIEKFIRENRQELDVYNPDKRVWKKIRRAKSSGIRIILKPILRAAVVLLIVGTGFLLYKITNRGIFNKKDEYIYGNQILSETELYYSGLINDLYQKATPYLVGNPEIETELKSDFSGLDSLCNDIKADLKDNVANQEVIEALTLNYRAKIRILEDMLVILGENDTTKKIQSHEL